MIFHLIFPLFPGFPRFPTGYILPIWKFPIHGGIPSPHLFIKFIDGFSMIFPYESSILGYPPDYGNHETPINIHKWPNSKRFGFLHGYR